MSQFPIDGWQVTYYADRDHTIPQEQDCRRRIQNAFERFEQKYGQAPHYFWMNEEDLQLCGYTKYKKVPLESRPFMLPRHFAMGFYQDE